MSLSITFRVVCVALILAGCAAKPPLASSEVVVFDCQNGEVLRVRFLAEPASAVLMRAQSEISLPQQSSGSGFIYSNGPNTIRGKGNALTVEIGRMLPIQCQAR
ncbi:MliC family protein [Methylophilus sp. UBA6697]|jgi:membrane-bound inhibitor of C-type lysozyme|uniref:MliC family protein n=1 Tax=Methylophilus sp. UBA6697 TaxID=1946902 RepID=UPI0025E54C02|nr:MliC family protein [Methylophilus sp. UBA6697]